MLRGCAVLESGLGESTRRRSAAPPFSTRLPFGASWSLPTSVVGDVPSGGPRKDQKPCVPVVAASASYVVVQKLVALFEMNPVLRFTACALLASISCSAPVTELAPSWYCLRLPSQRGLASESGRKTPMYTWFRFVPRTLIDTGSVVAANTLFTACTSAKICFSAFWIWLRLLAEKYFPLLTAAMLFSIVVCEAPPGLSVGQVS